MAWQLLRQWLVWLGATLAVAWAAPVRAQTVYSWNNSSTDPTNPASWTPAGIPTAADIAQLHVLGTLYPATINHPVLNVPAQVRQLRLAGHAQSDGWSISGTGSLSVGDSSNIGLVTRGAGTFTLELGSGSATSLSLAGPTGTTGGAISIGSGTRLVLTGNTVASASARLSIRSGTLVLDNSAGNPAVQRLSGSADLNLNGGGSTIEFRGAAAGTTFTGWTGPLAAAGAGDTYLRTVQNGTAALTVTFGSLDRTNTSGNHFFENIGSGFVGDPRRPTVTFTTAPTVRQGVISTSSATTIPWAVVTSRSAIGSNDVIGRWASYDTTVGVRAAPTVTFTGNFNDAPAGTNVLFVGPATPGQTVALSGSNQLASVVLEPQAANTTINIGSGGQINTLGIMLSGSRDLTITGGSLFSATTSGTRALAVVNPTTALITDSNLAANNSPLTISGPGFVILNGTSNQIAFGSSQNVNLAGGTLRVTSTNFHPANATIRLRGGVLEYDVSGGNFTFNLALGTAANQVNWTSNAGDAAATNVGSGGFSAYSTVPGRRLFVNLYGDARTLTWNDSSQPFVTDGYALIFGSLRSNATVAWQNPIALDSGTPSTYNVREIRVIRGEGNFADKTALAGAISGSENTDLLKTGNGVLELVSPNNSYRGNTLIREGTLVVADNASIGTPTSRAGDIIVHSGARLAGTGQLMPDDNGKAVYVQPGGIIRGGNPSEPDAAQATGTLTVYGNLRLLSSVTESAVLQFEANRTGSGTANASKIDLGAPFNAYLDLGTNGKLAIELVKTTATSSLAYNETYTVTLLTVNGSGRIYLNGNALSDGYVFSASQYELRSAAFAFDPNHTLTIGNGGTALVLTFTPVPEPAAALAIAAAAGGLLLVARRVLRTVARVAAAPTPHDQAG